MQRIAISNRRNTLKKYKKAGFVPIFFALGIDFFEIIGYTIIKNYNDRKDYFYGNNF